MRILTFFRGNVLFQILVKKMPYSRFRMDVTFSQAKFQKDISCAKKYICESLVGPWIETVEPRLGLRERSS